LLDSEIESEKVSRLADELWGQDESARGAGRFIVTADRSGALRKMGVGEDFKIAGRAEDDLGPLDFIHRRTTDDEFYFVRNKTRDAQSLVCRFRVAAQDTGQIPEFWWPQSGLRSACSDWRSVKGGYTELTVQLAPLGSVFVVFRKPKSGDDASLDRLATETFAVAKDSAGLTLDGDWQVEFPEGWGAPQETTFSKLESWTESEDEGIRSFSGIATYRKSFDVPASLAAQERLFLQLGDLAEIAEVSLNGKPLGLVWLPPFRIEITDAIRAGTNTLEIRVANLWANRLNGDSLLPEADRFTRSNLDRMQTDPTSDSSYGRIPNGPTRPVYSEIPPLMKSGLLGPVQIVTPNLGG
jgi:hypothetical protein